MFFWLTLGMFFCIGHCHKCADFYNQEAKVIYNFPLKNTNGTTRNETCNYEILAPEGRQVEMLFDVYFHFRSHFPCAPNTKPINGIFISYTHGDNVTYYDVICNNKSSYLVRSIGRRLYLKIITTKFSFSFRGAYRYVDPSNCIQFHCLNGGTCVTANGQRFCICPIGFSGKTCSECSNFTCYNGGSCIILTNYEPSCVCDINFEGSHCEHSRNPCLSNPCLHGRCEIMATGRHVTSPYGHFYKYARGLISTDLSITNHTFYNQLNESRENDVEQWRCACYPGYTGIQCENNVNECDVNPCSHGRNCINGVDEFNCSCHQCVFGLCLWEADDVQCRCFPGFTGENCSRNVNECDLNPCIHGDCVDFVNGYYCSCLMNFTGRTCNISLTESVSFTNGTDRSSCSEHTCEGGICLEQNMVPKCQCSSGFNGTRCDVPLTVLFAENTTFISRKHTCFAKTDLEAVCSCALSLCKKSHYSTVCDVLTFVSSLFEFCSTEFYSSICVSYIDTNSLFLIQYTCEVSLNHTNSSISLGKDQMTTREPIYGNAFSHLKYRLQCRFSNSDGKVTVDFIPIETPSIDMQYLYLNSNCTIQVSASFLHVNCSLSGIQMQFNSSEIPVYFKSIYLVLSEADISKSLVTQQISNSVDFHQTFSSFIESRFVLIDNTTLSLNTSITGKTVYYCQQKCSEDDCKKNCELEEKKLNYGSSEENNNLCPCSKTGIPCDKTKDGGGSQKTDSINYTALYLIVTATIILIIMIPGTAVVCIRRSKQRGESVFPELAWHSPKIRPIHVSFQNEKDNRQFKATRRGQHRRLRNPKDIRMIKNSRIVRMVRLEGVETGKSEV